MNDSPLNCMPQGEWDAFISSILKPFLIYAKNDPLISYDDLQQEAWVALLSAASNYDPTKAKFSTYSYYYIRGRMLRYVLEKSRLASSRIDSDPLDIEKGYVDNSSDEQEQMKMMLGVVADEPYSNFLIEYYIKGKSFRTIAKENNMSHQGVASHIKKLLALLEKRLHHENA